MMPKNNIVRPVPGSPAKDLLKVLCTAEERRSSLFWTEWGASVSAGGVHRRSAIHLSRLQVIRIFRPRHRPSIKRADHENDEPPRIFESHGDDWGGGCCGCGHELGARDDAGGEDRDSGHEGLSPSRPIWGVDQRHAERG